MRAEHDEFGIERNTSVDPDTESADGRLYVLLGLTGAGGYGAGLCEL
jgi:hypothetical protein